MLGLTFCLFLLGINKQLDLQILLTQAGRWLAWYQGWYADRRGVQFAFLIVVGLVTSSALILALVRLRPHFRSGKGLRGTLGGFALLMCFVAMRAASFHHLDHFLGWGPSGFVLNHILELSGTLLVAAGLWRRLRWNRALMGGSGSFPETPSPNPE